ncbi:hypothetical protein F5Y08DRAFT_355714 [Xylaria arbuscula]|nr:hypothetical protein F5Y08DRAFT_355714 [Xylaria arbuscula]
MKIASLLSLVASWQTLAAAYPNAHRDLIESPDPPVSSISGPKPRQVAEVCQAINTGITLVKELPPEWQVTAVGLGAVSATSGLAAWSTCEGFFNGTKCSAKGWAIGSYVGIALSGVILYNNLPIRGVQLAVRDEELHASYTGLLTRSGLEFDAVNIMPLARRGAGDDDLATEIQILGLRDENDLVTDHSIHIGNRSAVSHISTADSSYGVGKRASGPGFKVAYDFTYAVSGDYVEEDDINNLAYDVGLYWAKLADQRHTMGTFKANLKMGASYTVDLDIIPENGDNWNPGWETLNC